MKYCSGNRSSRRGRFMAPSIGRGGSLRPDSGRPGRCDRSVNVPCARRLTLDCEKSSAATGRKLRKFRETATTELLAQTLGERRSASPARPRTRRARGRRRDDTRQLVEERDHVAERDQLERAVVVRQLLRIGDLVTDTPATPSAALPLRSSASRCRRPPPQPRESARRPSARPRRSPSPGQERGEAAVRARSRAASTEGERLWRTPSVPGPARAGRTASAQRAPRAPQQGPADDNVGDDAGEALAEGHGCVQPQGHIFAGVRRNISAALPRLIATATLRYESS